MKLEKYKVNKFRSVKGTDWIDIDKWSCFVGVNESGKTNLLLPLWKFNPADNATEIDLLVDYPRDEYHELDKDSDLKNEAFIEVLFKISEKEREYFEKLHEDYQTKKQISSAETSSEEKVDAPLKIEKIGFSTHLLIKKDYEGRFWIFLSNENCDEESDDLEKTLEKEVFKKICSVIPRFVYYSEYGNLDSDLFLPRVIEDLKRLPSLSGKERMKARTLKILFDHLTLEPQEILNLGLENNPDNNPLQKNNKQVADESRNKLERVVKLSSAATHLTRQFQEWWKQGNYIFHFKADGQYFRILVSDKERPEEIELESRSKGLQWFFSFFLVFLAESDENHKNCILLLDEPGLSLHPNAQTDLIRFFHQLSRKNQIIYTTHLPFLVDHNNLDKVKAVYTEKGLTKISNDLNKADKERKAIQPVNAAIGITASQSLLVGCDIVIVEGVSDQFYLTMIKNHLVATGKFKPKKELVFMPVGGVKGIKPVVSIVQGSTAELPFVLLDSDTAGKEAQTSLKKGFYNNDDSKVLEADIFTGKKGSEIEDLIPLDLIVDNFDRLFRTDEGIELADLDGSKPVIPQLEAFASNNQIDLKNFIGWKVELSKRIKQKFKGDISDELEQSWISLFETLQGGVKRKKVANAA
jgi:predicted ATPase